MIDLCIYPLMIYIQMMTSGHLINMDQSIRIMVQLTWGHKVVVDLRSGALNQ